MAVVEGRDRLSSLSADNHQPWLWVTHMFSLAFVTLTALIRTRIKRRHYGIEDAILLVSHFVFGSRILLALILCTVQISNILLVYNIFTKSVEPSRISLYVLLGVTLAQGFIVRWIIFTTFETVLECAPIIRVMTQVTCLQVSRKTKIFVVAAFSSRLVVLIPAWVHVACYDRFLKKGRSNIGIVSTIITEELWASIALFSASIPVLMRVAKQFTVSREVGDRIIRDSRYVGSSRSKKTLDHNIEMTPTSSQGNWQPLRNKTEPYLHEDNYNAAILSKKKTTGSINSASESQVGILREVQVEVSSLRVHKESLEAPVTR
uniref:Uncharacterized protein n=1 Tax=Coccidioides posadasii RMSCC 3488 TaxID=454284 RepID=A0A0J6FLE9_COCPO|nr:hypothetical protein CPAG_06577 [Coccidioides posadasii RMSCC 3488]